MFFLSLQGAVSTLAVNFDKLILNEINNEDVDVVSMTNWTW